MCQNKGDLNNSFSRVTAECQIAAGQEISRNKEMEIIVYVLLRSSNIRKNEEKLKSICRIGIKEKLIVFVNLRGRGKLKT